MSDIEISLKVPTAVAQVLAVSRGWTPMVEDTSQPLEGDAYPQIPNPVSFGDYVAGIGAEFLIDQVLREGRARVITEFSSIFDGIAAQVKAGAFDPLILQGDLEGIKQAVIGQLAGQPPG